MTLRRRMPWLLLAGILLLALNLRGPIVAVAPVLDQIRADLGFSAAMAGLLTTIPVLCFALATPLASGLIGRAGPERSIALSLLGVLVATVIRSAGDTAAIIIGTALLGVSITIGNVVVPVVIRRDFPPQRVGIATGAYTSALNVGSMITSLATVPLAEAIGWQWAIGLWAVFVFAALALLGPSFGWRALLHGSPTGPVDPAGMADLAGKADLAGPVDPAGTADPSGAASTVGTLATDARGTASNSAVRPTPGRREVPRRSLTAWALMLAFGGQAFSYYGITAWLPTLLHDSLGLSMAAAGAGSSIFQILAVVGALGVPMLAHFWRPWAIIALVGAAWVTLPIGLLVAPELWWLWSTIAGAAQGGGITIVFIVIVRLARSDTHARRLSAFVQGGGYLLASVGPSIVGAAHEATGDWLLPMLIVLTSALTLAVAGIISALRADRRLPELS